MRPEECLVNARVAIDGSSLPLEKGTVISAPKNIDGYMMSVIDWDNGAVERINCEALLNQAQRIL